VLILKLLAEEQARDPPWKIAATDDER